VQAFERIVKAVKQEKISRATVQAAYDRITAMKESLAD
jgi:hypothetical protein